MKTKTISYILITIVIIGFVIWKLAANKSEMNEMAERSFEVNPTVPVRICTMEFMDLANIITVDGRVKAGNEVTVYSKVQGIVLRKYKRTGDMVQKGAVIAQVENSVIKETLGLAQLNLANAEKDVERYKKLADANAVTQREYEAILITYREAQKTVTELKDQLSNTTLVAPLTGVLEVDYFEEGTLLSLGTQVADFVDPSELKAVVSLTEKDVFKVRKGDKVTLTTDVVPDVVFSGIVDVIGSKGNNQLSYSVEIVISGNNTNLLKPGMYVSATLSPNNQSVSKSMIVNRKSIIESLKKPEVYVVKDNKAYKREISIGKVSNDYVEVIHGLQVDDIVVISGQINLTDGRSIDIIR